MHSLRRERIRASQVNFIPRPSQEKGGRSGANLFLEKRQWLTWRFYDPTIVKSAPSISVSYIFQVLESFFVDF